MFERYTAQTTRVVVVARNLARDSNASFIDVEHLLSALAHENVGSSLVKTVLNGLGIFDAVAYRAKDFARSNGRGSSAVIPFSFYANTALELAESQALRLDSAHVHPEHVLLAIFGDERLIDPRIFETLSFTNREVRLQVLLELAKLHPSKVLEAAIKKLEDEEDAADPMFEYADLTDRVRALLMKLLKLYSDNKDPRISDVSQLIDDLDELAIP